MLLNVFDKFKIPFLFLIVIKKIVRVFIIIILFIK